jgi:CRISPR-associated protein Csx17
MPEIVLSGCEPEPLMSYLKTLGVFRLVGEQADPDVRLSWAGGVARLHGKLDRAALEEFFLEKYQPTPITAPWNGGSGFYGGGSEPLDAISRSTTERLARYRETIARIRNFAPKSKPKDEEKASLLVLCRSELADEIVPWLDVCFVLGENGPSFFPLLGTGGNDGRLEFTNNFMQRLADIIPFANGSKATANSKEWLSAAVFADTLVQLGKTAIGQFNPGGIGGANGTQGRFEADSRVNPWEFVLMIEGVLLFAGSVARRLGANSPGRAVFPFSVDSVAVGYGSATASEETTDGSRSELWLPLWSEPVTFMELKHLFAEGRAQLRRRQARNAVEFALAVNLLGVCRGVASFVRYGFLKRNGLAFLAVPLGRLEVTLRPQARLLDDPALTEWLDRLRSACRDKDKTPARYQTALRQIDRAMFEFANRSGHGNDAKYLLEVLRALGRAEQTMACGLAFCKENYVLPLQGLSPLWLDQANDGSPEFRLAASLAGIRALGDVGPLRAFLEEVEVTKFVNWSPGNTSAVWSKRPLVANLAVLFRRRLMEAFRESETWGRAGVPLDSPRPARLEDVIAFLGDGIDESKLGDLTWGLLAIDWPAVEFQLPDTHDVAAPFEFGVPRLLVEPRTVSADGVLWRLAKGDESDAKPDPDVFHILASGRSDAVGQCVDRAAQRLKSGGRLVHGYGNRRLAGRSLAIRSLIPAERLLAAMLFPLSDRDLETIVNTVLNPPENEE